MQQSPKPYINKFRNRHHAVGVERRRNMSKLILEKGTPFPKPIEYADIDSAMYDWVDKKINLVYDGKRLPTYKLYSTQRISEYIQTWKDTDKTNSLNLNFKTITREFNPQKGDIQGGYFNIPGHKNFAMFYVPVLEENGTEAFDRYTMKQPFGVNFTYSISVVTNKMEILNDMNEQMLYEFNAINCYIAPNDHPMSMTLEEISDDSEYTIDDRKYYSQTYKVKVRGYIIRKEDYQVERLPSRFVLSSHDSDSTNTVRREGKNHREEEKVMFMSDTKESLYGGDFMKGVVENNDKCELPMIDEKNRHVEVYEFIGSNDCCEDEPSKYSHKKINIIIDFGDCEKEVTFVIDKEMVLEQMEIENVYDFKILVNEELINLENDVKFLKDDSITVRISRDDEFKTSKITLIGYDPYEVVDNNYIAESSLDEKVNSENIYIEDSTENDL